MAGNAQSFHRNRQGPMSKLLHLGYWGDVIRGSGLPSSVVGTKRATNEESSPASRRIILSRVQQPASANGQNCTAHHYRHCTHGCPRGQAYTRDLEIAVPV